MSEIRNALEHISTQVPPRELAQLWKEKLIPEWSKNLDDISVFEFRRLVNNFDSIYGSMISKESGDSLDEATKLKIFQYLDTVSPEKELCLDALSTV